MASTSGLYNMQPILGNSACQQYALAAPNLYTQIGTYGSNGFNGPQANSYYRNNFYYKSAINQCVGTTVTPTPHPFGSPVASVAPSYQPSKPGATTTPTFKYAPSTAPTLEPTTALPTRSPLASDGCVHVGFMALQSQTYINQYFTVPTFGKPGEQIYYNVTIILAAATVSIGLPDGSYDSGVGACCSLTSPSKYGPYSVLAGDTGVMINFYPYYAGSYFRATVCPYQTVPTAMPTPTPISKSLTSFIL